ncbi:MAG: two-component sensor histidine kinase [Ignavibacteriaceae bacterium]|nr:two-component sensor histidine kinase [Ignavibacteriaceae bacterium]
MAKSPKENSRLKKFREYIAKSILRIPEEGTSPERYRALRRNIMILMILVTIIPLSLMATINYYQYQKSLKAEIFNPLNVLTNKTKRSFELFLEERLSTIRFISSAYSCEDLSNEKILNRTLLVLKKEFEGFVDLALINSEGELVNYAGPYDFLGKDYSQQSWFHAVLVKGWHISDVFMGYRKFPHVAIAIQNLSENDQCWILRATIDTKKFDAIIAMMELDQESDAFIINKEGILQTDSRFYGKILEECSLSLPPGGHGTYLTEEVDNEGRDIFIAYTRFVEPEFTLVVVKPSSLILKTWFTFRTEIFFIFIASVLIIVLLVFKLTDIQVSHIKEADEKRELAFRELEHSQKLSSIGRLAAGVAHEINNPLAIICQKAGLMNDLIDVGSEFKEKPKFIELNNSILQSVNRCSTVTHRLLGFARRMEVEYEELDLNEVLQEVIGFLEKEALHRNIKVVIKFDPDLPQISSDRSQLQQVFLNILANGFAAVEDGGIIKIKTWVEDDETEGVSILDNGCGMSKKDLDNIFEPFFTTKKGYGTGLGLPITYGIIKKMGGTINVKSTEGVGSTFTILLPKKLKKI